MVLRTRQIRSGVSLIWVWSWSLRSVGFSKIFIFLHHISSDGILEVSPLRTVLIWYEFGWSWSLRLVAVRIWVSRYLIWSSVHADIDAERRLTRGLRLLTITILDTLDHQDRENTPHECFVGLIQKFEASRRIALISSCGPSYVPVGRHNQWISTLLIVTVPAGRLSRSSFSCALITLIRICVRCL